MHHRAIASASAKQKIKSLRKVRLDFIDKLIQSVNFDSKTESFQFTTILTKSLIDDCYHDHGDPSSSRILPFGGILDLILAAVYSTAFYTNRSDCAQITKFQRERDLRHTEYDLTLKCSVNLESGLAELTANDGSQSSDELICSWVVLFSEPETLVPDSSTSHVSQIVSIKREEVPSAGSYLIAPLILEMILGAGGFTSFAKADLIYLDRKHTNCLRGEQVDISCTCDQLDSDRVSLMASADGKVLLSMTLVTSEARPSTPVTCEDDFAALSAVHTVQGIWMPGSDLSDASDRATGFLFLAESRDAVETLLTNKDCFLSIKEVQANHAVDLTMNGKANHVILLVPSSMLVPTEPGEVDPHGEVQVWEYLVLLSVLCSRCKNLLVVLMRVGYEQSIPYSGGVCCALMEFPQTKVKILTISGLNISAEKASLNPIIDREIANWDKNSDVEIQYRPSERSQWVRHTNVYSSFRLSTKPLTKTALKSHRGKTRGAVIVTGGLGGLGLVTAEILLRVGWSKVVLVSRTGAVSYAGQGLEDMLAALMSRNGSASVVGGDTIEVVILRCDVSVESEVESMLDEVRNRFKSIGGLVHAAGVAKDCALKNIHLFKKSVSAVWQSKALSCSWLSKHTARDSLSLFVVYSSIAAAVGNAGQASYCVANKFIEELVAQRATYYCKALAIQWPAIAGVGMAAALAAKIAKMNAARGAKVDATAPSSEFEIDSDCVSALLLSLLSPTNNSVNGTVTIIPKTAGPFLATAVYAKPIHAAIAKEPEQKTHLNAVPSPPPLYRAALLQSSPTSQCPGANSNAPMLTGSKEGTEATRIAYMIERILGSPVDCSQPLMTQGLDSLGVSELAILLNTEFALKLDATFIFNHPSVDSICAMISAERKPPSAAASKAAGAAADSVEKRVTPNAKRGSAFLDVGVVGIACRLSGGIDSLTQLWDSLKDGHNLVSEQKDRWDVNAVKQCVDPSEHHASLLDRINRACFLRDSDLNSFNFDCFKISRTEALQMDLTQRHLLQLSYEALLDSGISIETAREKVTGVFVAASGITSSMNYSFTQSNKEELSAFDATKNTLSVAAGRISFALGLRGPSLAIDTACSSALVALHTARRSLQLHECDIAIVASVNIIDLESSVKIAMAGMLSTAGVCATFDASADGYGRGEGGGAVVLRRMDNSDLALAAVKPYIFIAGSAVMQDGESASLTAPNGKAQQELIRTALVDANMTPSDISVIESHGTGTKLGDPVETTALAAVFRHSTNTSTSTSRTTPLYVTGIKASVGHLEAAAGMAGLFSAILSLQQGEVPPNAGLKTMNETVAKSMEGSAIQILSEPASLSNIPELVAGISSFGYSGTIAHVIVKKPSQDETRLFTSNVSDAVVRFRQGQQLLPTKWTVTQQMHSKLAALPVSVDAKRSFDDVLKVVREVVLSMIGSDYQSDYSSDAPLLEIGVDSMGASEIVVHLERRLGVKDLPGTLIFLCPTASSIAQFIFDKLPQEASGLTALPAPAAEMRAASGHVAITGVSCHFGDDLDSLEKLWDLLRNKKSNISKTTWNTDEALKALSVHQNQSVADRLKQAHYAHFRTKWNHSEFGITANEAKTMPKLQKVLLTMVKKALLDANYDFASPVTKNIGIFVGACGFHGSFPQVGTTSQAAGFTATTATSNSLSVSAGRISYTFGFTGPCMTIDTACSSSLVALHTARRSLQLHECDLAVVCSANILDLESSIAVAVAGMTSRTGRCHTFDESADGYSRGEGAGAVVLQRADEAIEQRVQSYATITGSAVMQDGRSASLTAPNAKAQESVIQQSLKESGVTASEVAFIESHGTGTKLGDPVETTALAAVFRHSTNTSTSTSRTTPLYVTGIKASVGHLEAAAGMAGLFSAILSLQQGEVPPNGQLDKLNSEVQRSMKGTRIEFPTTTKSLDRNTAGPLVGGVSSFGFSGTIAHITLQQAPSTCCRKPGPIEAPASPITVSTFTDSETEQELVPVNAEQQLDSEVNNPNNNTVWQFTGQGRLTVNCGREIHDSEPAFRAALSQCDQILRQHQDFSLTDLLYPDLSSRRLTSQKAQELLDETQYLQPVLVALEYCLATVWLAQGLKPWAVVGHSIGEYAASVVAGVMSVEDCLRLVCCRGRLTHQHKRRCNGSMYAVRATVMAASEAVASAKTSSSVAVAAINGPQSVVISGTVNGVEQTLRHLPSGTGKVKLGVSYGFHSPVMQDIIPPYSGALKEVIFNAPKVHFISSVRGREVSKELLQHQYWLDHVLNPVRYQEAVEACYEQGGRTFVEMGPSSTLTKLAKGILVAKGVDKEDYSMLSCIE